MKIKYLAHACFLITADNGTTIITDPYETGDRLKYDEIQESADIVTVSHEHFDHNNASAVRGNPAIVKETATVKGTKLEGFPSYHDDVGGAKRGTNTIFCFEVDGVRVCRLGDLGHGLDDRQIAGLGKVDILLIPVGGTFTIDAPAATLICDQLKPKVVIPMHFRTDRGLPDVAVIEPFLEGKDNVSRLEVSEVEFKQFPSDTQIIVLKPAL